MGLKRKILIYKLGFYLVSVLFLLPACVPTNTSKFVCLPTETNFSYPVDQWTNGKTIQTLIPPDENGWVLQSEDIAETEPEYLIAKGNDDLWILGSKLTKFNTQTKVSKDYKIVWNSTIFTPRSIFLTKKGDLWAIGTQEHLFVPLLSKYDETRDEFIPSIDSKNILFLGAQNVGISEASNGQIWLAIPGIGLYVYDPADQSASKVEGSEFNVYDMDGHIAVDRFGRVWLGTSTEDIHRFIYRYDPESSSFSKLSLGSSLTNIITSLYLDSQDRLWIGDYAFWDVNQPLSKEGNTGLNLVFRSPAFITRQVPFVDYYWVRPKILFEDKERNIWFSGSGLVFLNTTSGEWCKVFDSASIATQDSEGVIWAVSGGKVYDHR